MNGSSVIFAKNEKTYRHIVIGIPFSTTDSSGC